MKTAIDLFCGCGGISSGLKMAGYKVLSGIDIEKKYISTFSHNFPESLSITESLIAMTPASLADRLNMQPGQLDILVGGPPCQGFSKNVPRKYRYLDDPKNALVHSFIGYAGFFLPKIIIMENVAEMKNGFGGYYTDEVTRRLSDFGYTVTYGVLNAADYGVPQRRRRAFFIANRLGCLFQFPQQTHFSAKDSIDSLFQQQSHVSVWDAIGDLPSLVSGGGDTFTPYAESPFSAYQAAMRTSTGAVANHIARPLKPRQLERLSSLKPGQGLKDLPPHLQTKGGYSGAYGRLTKDMIAPTITRWVFHPGSGRWGHPVDTRIITIREVARIQGFPDDFEFVGSYNEQAGQLGNAVPPLLLATLIQSLNLQLSNYMSESRLAN